MNEFQLSIAQTIVSVVSVRDVLRKVFIGEMLTKCVRKAVQ